MTETRTESTGRLRRGLTSDRGSTIVAVIATITSVLLVGVAIFTLGHSEGDLVEYAVDDARAFYVAEGGIERARAWLGDLLEEEPGANPVGAGFENQALGGGIYTVSVVDELSGGGWLPAYEVVCEADVDGAVRTVRSVMVPETFAKYQWFVERDSWRWFKTGDRFEGPVRVNGRMKVNGDPWFGGRVTVGSDIRLNGDSAPVYEEGYELNVGNQSMPDVSELEAGLRTAALNGGLYSGTLSHGNGFYHVRLGHPSVGELTYEGLRPQGGGYRTIQAQRTVDIGTLNGAVWFDEPIAIEGTLDGQLTIFSNGKMEIWDDLLYDASTPGLGPDPGCDDVLGLIADGDIEISYTTANQHDCEIHGSLIALDRRVFVERYGRYAPRGDLYIYGGLMAEYAIYLGRYYSSGAVRNGYDRHYMFDPRLSQTPPPYFPLTGRYIIHSWEELDPPEA